MDDSGRGSRPAVPRAEAALILGRAPGAKRVRDADHCSIQRIRSATITGLALFAAIALAVAVARLALGGAPARAASFAPALPEASGGLDVLPFPGTPDAPPGTNIDFPALAPGQLVSVRVVGSRSGLHAGTLSAQPGGRGTGFAPAHPFLAGERVSVTAALRSEAAAAGAGATGARRLRFSFTIARPAPLAMAASLAADCAGASACAATPAASRGAASTTPSASAAKKPRTHTFHSAPQLHAPVVVMVGKDTDHAAGDIFLDARHSSQNGPYILDAAGGLLWFGRLGRHRIASDVTVQHYANHPVLTYYQGTPSRGVGVLLNEHYKRIHTVTAGDGYERQGISTHEFQLTPEGTALVEVHAPVHANLTSVGGPTDGVVGDSIIQEINIATNKVVWEWSAYHHIPLRDSYATYHPGQAYDAYHLNSLQQIPGGNLLVSFRHLSAVLSIHKKSGKINWELGGKHSDFSFGPGAHFEWQHDARLHSHGRLTVFDNGAGLAKSESESRALEIRLRGHRATLMHAYTHTPPVLAWSQGSVQLLPHGRVFVGWGESPTFSEYTHAGRQIFRAYFRSPIQSYRAFRDHWTGRPSWSPSIDVRPAGGGKFTIYASWNGATRVARWHVLGGARKSALKRIGGAPRRGFETPVALHTQARYFEVQAIAASGRVLGTSKVVKRGCGGPYC